MAQAKLKINPPIRKGQSVKPAQEDSNPIASWAAQLEKKEKAINLALQRVEAMSDAIEKAESLEVRVKELEADAVRLAELMGEAWGDVFRERAKEIVTKYQGE